MTADEYNLSGTIYEGNYTATRFFPDTVFPYSLYVPAVKNAGQELGLIVMHDGLNTAEAAAIEHLAQQGDAPYCICVGITAGSMPATFPHGTAHGMRMTTYDVFGPAYPAFVVEEFLPWIKETYGISWSASADMHETMGSSSGGISALNMAWYQTDYFHRVYMSSPSFLSMGKGNELLSLVRKCETKPLRIYTAHSETEPDDYFGSSLCAAEEIKRALLFAGYDIMSDYYPGEGHGSRYFCFESALKRQRFLWKDWQTIPVTVSGYSSRMKELILEDQPFRQIAPRMAYLILTCLMPAHQTVSFTSPSSERLLLGTYSVEENGIYFTPENGSRIKVAEIPGTISAIAVSSDKWRLYVSCLDRGCIYAMSIYPDGTLSAPYQQAALHLETDFLHPGAYDLCIDENDRLYAATESGIQCIRSYGLIDVILTLPANAVPDRIWFDSNGYLCVSSKEKVFCRKLLVNGPASDTSVTSPKYTSYYD